MNVLVIGNGGREHALAWKIAQSSRVERVFVAPGNAGTALDAENVDISPTDFARLIKFAAQNDVGLTVVGPELPLAKGIVDAFTEAKLRIFGPRKAAAELEGSKVFCKNLLRHADVPTADYQVFRNADHATTYLKDREDVPVVVKADGLASGKGVFVCATRAEADRSRQAHRPQQGIRRGRQPDRDRRAARRPRGQRAGDHRRPHDPHAARRPRTTSGPTTATPAPTPAAWAPIARRRWSTRKCCT